MTDITIDMMYADKYPMTAAKKLWLQLEQHSKYGYVSESELPSIVWGPHERVPYYLNRRPTKKYIVCCDINGQYLATWGQPFSTGYPELVANPTFDPKLMGYWRTTLPETIVTGGLQVCKSRSKWWTTPTIKFLNEIGYHPVIEEAWIFPGKAYPMRKMYEIFRTARENNPEEYLILKKMVHKFPGYLSSKKWTDIGYLIRPNWYHEMIGYARSNMMRALLKSDRKPFYLYADAAFFEADSHDDIPQGLTYTNQLGKWKISYVIPTDWFEDQHCHSAGSFERRRIEWLKTQYRPSLRQ